VKLSERDIKRFWAKVGRGTPDECWPWSASLTSYGYGQFGAQGKVLGAHRVAFYLAYRFWPENSVGHSCGRPDCCNPRHLAGKDVPAELPRHYGEHHRLAELPDSEVRRIRELYAEGQVSQAALAKRYGVTQVWIGLVVRGERRASAGGPLSQRGKGTRAWIDRYGDCIPSLR
jgi:hypothetical protein